MLVDFLTSKYHRTLEDAWGAFEIGNLEKAEKQFEKVIRHHADPHMTPFDLADAHAGLGSVSMAHTDFFGATRWYKEAHHLLDRAYENNWPKKLQWHHLQDRPALRILIGLGQVSAYMGKKSAAKTYYEHVLLHDRKDELGVRRLLEELRN